MEGNGGRRTKLPVFHTLSGLCFAGILSAMSIVLGKFLQIPNPFQDFIRISFENLPIILSGFALGPIAGALVGIASDLIGCVLYGYSINPIITLGAASVGLISGFIANYLIKGPLLVKVIVSVSASHIIGSVLIKSAGLAAWYLAKYEIGYLEFVLWRLLNYAIIATAESIMIYLLYRNRSFRNQIEGMCKK